MGHSVLTTKKGMVTTLRWLWRPVLLLAIGLHALVLLVPTQEQKKAPPKEDVKPVKITRLAPTKKAPTPPRVARARPQVQRRVAPPPPAIVTKATPKPSPTTSPGEAAGKGQKAGGKEGPKTDAVTQQFTESFVEFQVERGLPDGSSGFVPLRAPDNAPITAELFPNPTDFFSDPTKLTKRAGLVTFEWFSPIQPDNLFENYVRKIYEGKGFAIALKGEYGGGPVYEVKKGSDVRYFNIVPTGDKTGTLIMVWKTSPV